MIKKGVVEVEINKKIDSDNKNPILHMFTLTGRAGKEKMVNRLKQILSEDELKKCVVVCYGKSENFHLHIITDQDFSSNIFSEWEGAVQIHLINNIQAYVLVLDHQPIYTAEYSKVEILQQV